MTTSNNSISGINNYIINSYGELKIDISILYFLDDELNNFYEFYRLNENKFDLFLKIEYTFINDYEEGYEMSNHHILFDNDNDEIIFTYIERNKIYFEKYHFFIRSKIDGKLIIKFYYETLYQKKK